MIDQKLQKCVSDSNNNNRHRANSDEIARVGGHYAVQKAGLLMRPEHSETKTKTETRECETETETKNLL